MEFKKVEKAYKIESTLIPNDLIISAHKEARDKWKGIIEKACPLLFPKVEYKIGQWGWVDDKIENYNNGIKWIGRVDQIDDNGNIWLIEHSVSGHYYSENGYRRICISSGASLTLATPSEVESHLKRVAKETGFKVGVKVGNTDNDNTGEIKSLRYEYNSNFDTLEIIDGVCAENETNVHEFNLSYYNERPLTNVRLATASEVESHLKRVAEEKGYVDGANVKCLSGDEIEPIGNDYYMDKDNNLWVSQKNTSIRTMLFKNETGKWATIIPSELTLEERVAKLEKMIKQ